MGKIIDLTGQKFSMLTVISPIRVYNRFGWHCQCDCGNFIDIESGNLRSGRTKSCGCQKNKAIGIKNTKSLVGQTFGELTVIEPTNKRSGGAIVWKCKCSCGNETEVSTGNLKNNHVKSCGCLKYKVGQKYQLQILNKRFGKLTTVEQLESKDNSSYWKCKCDCGNFVEIAGWRLTSGNVASCGCLKSKGEEKIAKILRENNISFEQQKTFSTCLSPNNKPLRFDFYVNNQYLIEYDGEQHFISRNSGWSTDEQLTKTKKYDIIKNEWCKINGIPLIRIPYTKFETLSLEDLILKELN